MANFNEFDGVPIREVSLAEYAEHVAGQSEGRLEEERERPRHEVIEGVFPPSGNRKARRAAAAKARRTA